MKREERREVGCKRKLGRRRNEEWGKIIGEKREKF